MLEIPSRFCGMGFFCLLIRCAKQEYSLSEIILRENEGNQYAAMLLDRYCLDLIGASAATTRSSVHHDQIARRDSRHPHFLSLYTISGSGPIIFPLSVMISIRRFIFRAERFCHVCSVFIFDAEHGKLSFVSCYFCLSTMFLWLHLYFRLCLPYWSSTSPAIPGRLHRYETRIAADPGPALLFHLLDACAFAARFREPDQASQLRDPNASS
jgi:hypothetical protein